MAFYFASVLSEDLFTKDNYRGAIEVIFLNVLHSKRYKNEGEF